MEALSQTPTGGDCGDGRRGHDSPIQHPRHLHRLTGGPAQSMKPPAAGRADASRFRAERCCKRQLA